MKSRRGRPRTIYLEDDHPDRVFTQITHNHNLRLEEYLRTHNMTLRTFIERMTDLVTLDKDQNDLNELREKYREATESANAFRVRIDSIEQKLRADEERRKNLRVQDMFPGVAFEHMLFKMRQANPNLKRISINEETMRRLFGITMNIERLNGELQEFLERYDSGEFTSQEAASRYSIRVVDMHPVEEKEILKQIILKEIRKEGP